MLTIQLLASVGLMAHELCGTQSQTQRTKGPNKEEMGSGMNRGDDPLSGMPMTSTALAAYNYPANVNASPSWDVYADASYIYWYPQEGGLDLGSVAVFYDETILPSGPGGFTVFQDTGYTSGFKVGIGSNLDCDDWVLDLQYTYLRQNTTTSSGAAPSFPNSLFDVSAWFYQNYYSGVGAASFNSKWKLGIDWIDLVLQRPFYQGRRLTVTPSAGLRASWIRQQLNMTGSEISSYDELATIPTAKSTNTSHSWAIGPRGVLEGRWLLGRGFRFQGNFGASLLFTQYTTISHSEDIIVSAAYPSKPTYLATNYNTLRPMLEANWGIGWGTYFCQQQYHVDFAATYDFNYLWAQNMMRYVGGLNAASTTSPGIGDLVLHGLDIKARFDF